MKITEKGRKTFQAEVTALVDKEAGKQRVYKKQTHLCSACVIKDIKENDEILTNNCLKPN